MSRPRRLAAFDYQGYHRYSLTICTHDKRPLFVTSDVVDLVTDQIRFTASEQDIEIPVYSFMPDHLHVLAAGIAECANLPRFMRLMKQRAAWRFSRRSRTKLWQDGYFDRVLRGDEATRDVIRYIIAN